MILEPQGEYLIVEKTEVGELTRGFYMPSRYQPKPDRGVVLAVGRGRRTDSGHVEPPAVAAGDQVAFSPYSGSDFKVDGQRVLVIKETDVMAILS